MVTAASTATRTCWRVITDTSAALLATSVLMVVMNHSMTVAISVLSATVLGVFCVFFHFLVVSHIVPLISHLANTRSKLESST